MREHEFRLRHPQAKQIDGMLAVINGTRELAGQPLLSKHTEIYFIGQTMEGEEERNVYALVDPSAQDAEPSYSIGFLGLTGSRPLLTWEEVHAGMGD